MTWTKVLIVVIHAVMLTSSRHQLRCTLSNLRRSKKRPQGHALLGMAPDCCSLLSLSADLQANAHDQ